MKTDTTTSIGPKKQEKLIRKYPSYLQSQKKDLEGYFGTGVAQEALQVAGGAYPGIVKKISNFHTPMYDALMVQASRMAALKKGLNHAGISTQQFIRFSIEKNRSSANRVPGWIKKLGGRIYLSRLMRVYLKRVAASVTSHGWPTRVIGGKKAGEADMVVETRECQMVKFWEMIGEGDIRPYCTFFDFTAAELLGIGLKQESSIDSGVCRYCFKRKGSVQWPEPVQRILSSHS